MFFFRFLALFAHKLKQPKSLMTHISSHLQKLIFSSFTLDSGLVIIFFATRFFMLNVVEVIWS